MNTEYGKNGEKIIERINKIELKNVSFSYPEGKNALSNINLTLQKGDKIAVVGKTVREKQHFQKYYSGFTDRKTVKFSITEYLKVKYLLNLLRKKKQLYFKTSADIK